MLLFILQEGESLTKEQIEQEIKKLKEAHAEDEGIYPFFQAYSLLHVVNSLALSSNHMMAPRNMALVNYGYLPERVNHMFSLFLVLIGV